MDKFQLKSAREISIMAEGGKRLRLVKETLAQAAVAGITPLTLDTLARELIIEFGGKPSFAMVAGYKFATCINVNEEVVHAIPDNRVLQEGDVIGIDVGMYYKGFHTDTAVSVVVAGKSKAKYLKAKEFLEVGKKGLADAIAKAKPGNRVADLSKAMELAIVKAGYSPVKALTGHGVGRNLHEEPPIPCFVLGNPRMSPKLVEGMVLAIEIMYNMGGSEVRYKNADGWTITTADGTISGLFEETVAVTKTGSVVLT